MNNHITSKNQLILDWQNYKFFPYEKKLALEEIKSMSKNKEILAKNNQIIIKNVSNSDPYTKTTYFSKIHFRNKSIETIQAKLEKNVIKEKIQQKQNTRYSVHGLHEYKGKFNPQIVKALLNILSVSKKHKVLDPFCGSGTTLVECTHNCNYSIGFDINPLAVYITNAKLNALSSDAKFIKNKSEEIITQYKINKSKKNIDISKRGLYLKKWFPNKIFNEIESLFNAIELKGKSKKNIFYSIASNILRDYSLQEPTDLRIRKRKSKHPTTPLIKKFQLDLEVFCKNLKHQQNIIGKIEHDNTCYELDSRYEIINSKKLQITHKFDCVITSPPYATALPYIDTQRLSLVWLGIIEPSEIRQYESILIGSRESSGLLKKSLIDNMIENNNLLPKKIWKFCMELNNAIGTTDGFRRKDTPFLFYRYFSDMSNAFENISNMVKHNTPFAMIVGNNQTTLGGKLFNVNTGELLISLAKSKGWKLDRKVPLDVYRRYGIHNRNAVKSEKIIILRKK